MCKRCCWVWQHRSICHEVTLRWNLLLLGLCGLMVVAKWLQLLARRVFKSLAFEASGKLTSIQGIAWIQAEFERQTKFSTSYRFGFWSKKGQLLLKGQFSELCLCFLCQLIVILSSIGGVSNSWGRNEFYLWMPSQVGWSITSGRLGYLLSRRHYVL